MMNIKNSVNVLAGIFTVLFLDGALSWGLSENFTISAGVVMIIIMVRLTYLVNKKEN